VPMLRFVCFLSTAVSSLSLSAPAISRVVTDIFGASGSEQQSSRRQAALMAKPQKLRELVRLDGDDEDDAMSSSRNFDLTYGEFEFESFERLIEMTKPAEGEIFIDIGSGCGRLVCAAALSHPWSRAVGIEVVDELDAMAVKAYSKLTTVAAAADTPIPLAPCEFINGVFDEALPPMFELDAPRAVAFCDSSAFATPSPTYPNALFEMSEVLGTSLPLGSRVVVVDKCLIDDAMHMPPRWSFEELAREAVPNAESIDGVSDARVYELRPGRPA